MLYRLTISELIWIIQYHAHKYYCLDMPAIPDDVYDLYWKELNYRYPDCSLLAKIGSGICESLHRPEPRPTLEEMD